MSDEWLQIRGDPSIREFLFLQERRFSKFDRHMDQVLSRIADLMFKYGVFHAKIHFSSGQVTLWLVDDPKRYKVHVREEFIDMDLVRHYPSRPYTHEAVVHQETIVPIMDGLKRLRFRDPPETSTNTQYYISAFVQHPG